MISVPREAVPAFDELGIVAFTTTRQAGDFNLEGREPSADVFGRWWSLLEEISPLAPRLASARQVHGTEILAHDTGWMGWLRATAADGHASFERPTAMAVSLADCVPIFIAHPSGAAAVLHSGWRGTAARLAEQAVDLFSKRGFPASDLVAHLGPGICGACYVVGPEVSATLTGKSAERPVAVDLRALLETQLDEAGVRRITSSASCTRCHNDRFFSHRAGDAGRQIGVIVSRIL